MPAAIGHLRAVAGGGGGPCAKGDQKGNAVLSVLAKWTDGLYYRVEQVKTCDERARKCSVVFEDQFEMQTSADNVHIQLDLDLLTDEHIVCCVCDGGASDAPNEIVICDTCQQGYHIQCHEPKVDRELARLEDDLVEWTCATCKYIGARADALAQESCATRQQQLQQTPAKKRANSLGANNASASTTPRARRTTANGRKARTQRVKQEASKRVGKLNGTPTTAPATTITAAPTTAPIATATIVTSAVAESSRRILRGGDSDTLAESADELTLKEKNDTANNLMKPPKRERPSPNANEVLKASRKGLKIKLPEKKGETPPVDTPSYTSTSSSDTEHLPSGATSEKMPFPAFAEIAKSVASGDDSLLSTDNLINLIEQ